MMHRVNDKDKPIRRGEECVIDAAKPGMHIEIVSKS